MDVHVHVHVHVCVCVCVCVCMCVCVCVYACGLDDSSARVSRSSSLNEKFEGLMGSLGIVKGSVPPPQ